MNRGIPGLPRQKPFSAALSHTPVHVHTKPEILVVKMVHSAQWHPVNRVTLRQSWFICRQDRFICPCIVSWYSLLPVYHCVSCNYIHCLDCSRFWSVQIKRSFFVTDIINSTASQSSFICPHHSTWCVHWLLPVQHKRAYTHMYNITVYQLKLSHRYHAYRRNATYVIHYMLLSFVPWPQGSTSRSTTWVCSLYFLLQFHLLLQT